VVQPQVGVKLESGFLVPEPAGKPSPEALDAWAAEGQLTVETRTAA
jgi:hypothetical protein